MEEKTVQQYYTPPPKLGRWEGFKIFLWNSETHQFLGRTGASWGKILLFYILFYTCLVGFFSAMLAVFYQTLDMKVPKRQLDDSLIGDNPGLGFRPMPPESNVESTLIWYNSNEPKNIEYWTEELDKFLEEYRKQQSQNSQTCTYDSYPQEGKVCSVDLKELNACNKDNKYNYPKAAPCIFLKLNKIYGWIPDYFNDTENLPGNMPDDLKVHISNQKVQNPNSLKTVWVSCEGENPADVENMGPIQYLPRRGFPGFYFPYSNIDGYLSPIVAIFFERPATGVLINIECKAWAHNIHHDRAERRGSVHFELMVDE